jgi:hypothetical protein
MPTSVLAAAERGASGRNGSAPIKVQVLSVCVVWYRKSPTVANKKKEEAYPGWQVQSEGSSLPALTVVVPGGQLVHGFVVRPYE